MHSYYSSQDIRGSRRRINYVLTKSYIFIVVTRARREVHMSASLSLLGHSSFAGTHTLANSCMGCKNLSRKTSLQKMYNRGCMFRLVYLGRLQKST